MIQLYVYTETFLVESTNFFYGCIFRVHSNDENVQKRFQFESTIQRGHLKMQQVKCSVNAKLWQHKYCECILSGAVSKKVGVDLIPSASFVTLEIIGHT